MIQLNRWPILSREMMSYALYARARRHLVARGRCRECRLSGVLLAQLIAARSTRGGQLRVFLMKAAEIFEERTERTTQRLSALAEPAMIIMFGAIVAFVALSLLQAIYGINANSFK